MANLIWQFDIHLIVYRRLFCLFWSLNNELGIYYCILILHGVKSGPDGLNPQIIITWTKCVVGYSQRCIEMYWIMGTETL